MLRRRILFIATASISACIAIGATSCTKSETPQAPTTSPAQPAAQTSVAQTAAAAQHAAPGKVEQEITISPDGDNLYWATKKLEVKAGSTVKLTLKNTASTTAGMPHNWVLTKPGTDQQVATDGMQAGEDHNWVAEGPNVIAHTALAKPGTEASVTFVAPPAGEYTYICTYPGHATTMNGKLISK
ncbi:MAG: plastocyanin/azurin family copper-binding protein [Oligoflexia bacterium]|nr:plastocyanin/azurin family copper-binding protein [Oligoflexia bacterium]